MSSKVRTLLWVLGSFLGLGFGVWLLAAPEPVAEQLPAGFGALAPPKLSSPARKNERERGVSDACAACEAAKCASRAGCDSIEGAAEAGPRKGALRSALCQELLTCARKTQCAPGSLEVGYECYCGKTDEIAKCATQGVANGPCKAAAEAAAESTDSKQIAERWGATEYALGVATSKLRCSGTRCRAECFPGAKN